MKKDERKMPLKFNNEGVLVDPDFHDGLLIGILLPSKNELTLLCQNVAGEKFSLIVSDLTRLRADNFLEGNIVFDIVLREGTACAAEDLKQLWDYSDDEAAKFLPSQINEIIANNWTLLQLNSSYGCELLALFRNRRNSIRVERTN